MGAWIDAASFGVGLSGLIISSGGLLFAILAFRAAYMAKTAAISAKVAADSARAETQRTIGRNLSTVDIENAVTQINNLKELHLQGSWHSARGNYQILRRTLIEIRGNLPRELESFLNGIDNAINRVNMMENRVTRNLFRHEEIDFVPRLNADLNRIQQNLETLQNEMKFQDNPGGVRWLK